MNSWRGKVVVVTGGSSGLGKAIATEFGAAGARVVLAARDSDRLQAAAGELEQKGIDVDAIAADVTEDALVTALFDTVIKRYQQLDVLVNCAGQSTRGLALQTSVDEFRELLEINFLATVRCASAAASELVASGGHLVNVGSLASKAAGQFLGAYPASKSPLVAYSQQLRFELGPQGVHVLLVCPGPLLRDDAGRRYDDRTGGLPESARRPGGGVQLKGIPTARVAALVRRACEQRTPELVIPGKAKLLFALSQLWPAAGDWIVKRFSK